MVTNLTDVVSDMVQGIVQRFHPRRVLLFGSHARGTALPDSDIDLLVVLDECPNKRDAAVEALRTLRHYTIPVDVVVTTTEELKRRGSIPGTVLSAALREGKVLYERA